MPKLPLFVANWKMYKSGPEVDLFFEQFFLNAPSLPWDQIFFAVPSIWIERAYHHTTKRGLKIGAQNSSSYEEGAFTGEISAKMIQSAKASFCLVGHSERRTLFKETPAEIHQKIKLLLAHGVQPLLCVGESKEERAQGVEKEIIQKQLLSALQGIPPHEVKNIMIAYEPVWSIGTGEIPEPSLVSQMHQFCKATLRENLGPTASSIPLLYGGSVKGENVESLLREKDLDGVLIGGASLSPEQFIDIILKGTQI